MLTTRFKKLSGTQLIALGFFLLILTGTLLLMLPFATKTGESTSFLTALFTSTSATCVTGLIVVDTFSHWTVFGQLVILTLIQIGGLGFITFGIAVSLILRKKIGLKQRGLIKESLNVMEIGGVVKLIRRVIKGTIFFEGFGAIILCLRFLSQMDVPHAIYYGIFHSISAFCNAGFDLMGRYEKFSSFTGYVEDPIVSFTLIALILIGGIGFFVWGDIADHKYHWKKYSLHTKMTLSASFVLVFGGAALFYLIEQNHILADLSTTGKICASFFGAVTPRTAGFNTIDTGALTDGGKLLTIILMFIGGASGSTAGGVKVTTVFILILHIRSTLARSRGTNIFGRRIDSEILEKASAVFCINLFLCLLGTLLLCVTQGFPLTDSMFEVISAISTVGMSAGLTGQLNTFSRILIIFLMYAGRIGSLSFGLVFTSNKKLTHIQLPAENVNIG